MDGVIVLQTIEKCSYTWGFSTIGLICGIFAIVAFILSFVIAWSGEDGGGFAVILAIILGIASFFSFKTAAIDKTWNRYQVLVDENVSMTEFLENYEIIETEGITIWVEEKDNENN